MLPSFSLKLSDPIYISGENPLLTNIFKLAIDLYQTTYKNLCSHPT